MQIKVQKHMSVPSADDCCIRTTEIIRIFAVFQYVNNEAETTMTYQLVLSKCYLYFFFPSTNLKNK